LGESANLADILERSPEAVVLLVDDGSGLLDTYTLEMTTEATMLLEGRRLTAILSPAVTNSWGWRERTLDSAGFKVLPCDASGLIELSRVIADLHRADISNFDPLTYAAERGSRADRLAVYPKSLRAGVDRFVSDRAPPRTLIAQLIEELRQYLGNRGFLWLASLAVYPGVQPDLTREIGQALSRSSRAGGFDPQLYLALARLPWIVQGRLPGWVRRVLLTALSPDEQGMVRKTILDILSRPKLRGAVMLEVGFPRWQTFDWSRLLSRSPLSARGRDIVFTRYTTPRWTVLSLRAPPWFDTNQTSRWSKWLVPGIAIAVAGSVSAYLFNFPVAKATPRQVLALICLGISVWQVGRAHFRDDQISRSGYILTSLPIIITPIVMLLMDSEFNLVAVITIYSGILLCFLSRLSIEASRLDLQIDNIDEHFS
jgi:hypothetical protein